MVDMATVLKKVAYFYPAWDEIYDQEKAQTKIQEAIVLMDELKRKVEEAQAAGIDKENLVKAVCHVANQIEAFRYRFLDGKIVLYDQVDTAFTYLNKETNLFKVVNVPMQNSMAEYVQLAEKTAENQKEYFTGPLGNDVFQCSPMPWVTYTHISHTNSGKKDNATPLFDWGKYYEKGDKLIMPISVQAHHSFVDGIHVGEFAKQIQKYVENI